MDGSTSTLSYAPPGRAPLRHFSVRAARLHPSAPVCLLCRAPSRQPSGTTAAGPASWPAQPGQEPDQAARRKVPARHEKFLKRVRLPRRRLPAAWTHQPRSWSES